MDFLSLIRYFELRSKVLAFGKSQINLDFLSLIRTFVPSMEIIYLNEQPRQLPPCVATIGFFDGVHVGHRYLINKVVETARREELASTVITFAHHPRQVLQPDWHPQLLSTFDEKVALLSQTDIDQLVILHFDREMANLSAHDFMRHVLLNRLNVKILFTGYDNRFGHREAGSTEGFNDYVQYGHEMGLNVLQGAPFMAADVRVSSSKIRRFLQEGQIRLANQCLGRPYDLKGKVVGGEHIGSSLGFPTANLQLTDEDKQIPAPGVYAVHVHIENSSELKLGMMNIGSRPTFGGNHQTLETHIFHFSGNLYGQTMTIKFVSRLRSEIKFDSREALIDQLEEDARQVEEILNQATGI